ncbi:MAG: NlpC/P60 family protein [Bulleidia sp.]|nr:NlpC/P60 family protein [Erysipelotrichaceae bacterium]MDD6662942.1 NlpC/P60 family protein [Bulleidia sp.]MDY4809127.1 NlpC/P60 family protein [Bulleidia sp.]
MQIKNTLTNKALKMIFPAFVIGGMIASALPVTKLSADDSLSADIPVFEISTSEADPIEKLKEAVIENRAEKDETIDLEEVDLTRSYIDIDGLNTSKTGIQAVKVKVNLSMRQSEDVYSQTSIGYSFIQDAVVKVTVNTAPKISLKSTAITVNNGDRFNPESFLAYANDSSGNLPALKITSDVDMNQDGEYTVVYTAVDQTGNSSTATLSVTVKTPQEVIDARIAAEEAAAEQARQEELERQRREEEERRRQAMLAAASTPVVTGDPSSVAGYAASFVGLVPYVWGGTTPAGWDCSGFTQYVFAQFGVSLPHYSGSQANCGMYVDSLANAQPGDLLANGTHAAIYIGGGMVVNALNPYQGTQICSVSGAFGGAGYSIRRIVG